MDTNIPVYSDTGSSQKETASPVTTSERIKTIDVVRGVALLGILLMNIQGVGIDGIKNTPINTKARDIHKQYAE